MTAPAGSMMLAQHYLRQSLANSATFRTWTETADEAAALAKIHYEGLPPPADNAADYTAAALTAYRPYAVVWTDEENGFWKNKEASGFFRAGGRLILKFEQDVPEAIAADPAEIDLRFKNTIGQIIDDLCNLTLVGVGYLCFERITVDIGPYRTHPDDVPSQGDWQAIEIGVDWSE